MWRVFIFFLVLKIFKKSATSASSHDEGRAGK